MQDQSAPCRGRPMEKWKYDLLHGKNEKTQVSKEEKLLKLDWVTADDGLKQILIVWTSYKIKEKFLNKMNF